MEIKRHHTRTVKKSKTKKKEKPYYMYVVQCGDYKQSYYCGITTDPDRRIKEHNESKKGAKYTRSRRPVRLMFTQLCKSRSDALKKEAAFKKLSRPQKLQYMCDHIEAEMLAQISKVEVNKMEDVNTPNNSVKSAPKPDNSTS